MTRSQPLSFPTQLVSPPYQVPLMPQRSVRPLTLSGLIVETPFQNGTLRHMKIEHMPCQLYGHSGYDLAALSAWVTMTTLTARAPATPLCHPVAYVAMLWVIPRTITVAPWLPKSLTKRWRPGGSLIVFLLLPLSISKPLQY